MDQYWLYQECLYMNKKICQQPSGKVDKREILQSSKYYGKLT